MCDLGDKRVIGVGVGQHGADREQDCRGVSSGYPKYLVLGVQARCRHTFGNGQGWGPLVSQNVQADASIAVDVGVVDAGGEVDLGRLERVVCWEVDCEEEDTARVWGVTLLRPWSATFLARGDRARGEEVRSTASPSQGTGVRDGVSNRWHRGQ